MRSQARVELMRRLVAVIRDPARETRPHTTRLLLGGLEHGMRLFHQA